MNMSCWDISPVISLRRSTYGKLRQGSGGTSFITVQQIIEKVTVNKTKLILKLDVDIKKIQ